MDSYIPKEIVDKLRSISSEEVALMLGLTVRNHKAHCFMHDDKVPSLSFYGPNRKMWKCFSCGKSGNAVSLFMEFNNIGFVEACQQLANQYGYSFDVSSNRPLSARPITPNLINISYPSRFKKSNSSLITPSPFRDDIAKVVLQNSVLTPTAYKFLFDERKLDGNLITAVGIKSVEAKNDLIHTLKSNFSEEELINNNIVSIKNGRSYLKFFTPCLLIPYRDINGSLIGLQTRYLGEKKDVPRFQFLFSSAKHLYNLPILDKMSYGDDLYVSEGITDCLALLSAGQNAIAIPSASNIPESELLMLKKFKLHMFPDNDEAGLNAFYNLRKILIQRGTSIRLEVLPNEFKDYAEYYVSLKANSDGNEQSK